MKGGSDGDGTVCPGATACLASVRIDAAGGPAVAAEARQLFLLSCRARYSRAPTLSQLFLARYRSIRGIVSLQGDYVHELAAVVFR